MQKTAKAFTLLLVLILAVLLVVSASSTAEAADPKIVRVPDDFSSIQAAIDNAAEGSTIQVKSGTYQEPTLRINKTLSLIGENAKSTLIALNPPMVFVGLNSASGAPEYWYDRCIEISADTVTISRLTITSPTEFYISGIGTKITHSNITSDIRITNGSQTISRNVISGTITCRGDGTLMEGNLLDSVDCDATRVVIKNNILEGGGISFGKGGNLVFNNTIRNGYGIGIAYGAAGNRIIHNNFINNTWQVSIEYNRRNLADIWGGGNTWDSEHRGNYWSDYKGVDRNRDGAGDDPYVMDGPNRDNYPLMSPVNVSISLTDLFGEPTPIAIPKEITMNSTETMVAVAAILVALAVIIVLTQFFRRHRKSIS